MLDDKLYDEATEVTARDGAVILDGPDGVDVQVTPEAAEQTADNLVEGAVKARGQRRLRNLPHKPNGTGRYLHRRSLRCLELRQNAPHGPERGHGDVLARF